MTFGRAVCFVLLVLLTGVGVAVGQSNTAGNYIRTTVYCNAAGTQKRTSMVYYDGLGRERLAVAENAGGANNPVGVRSDYDRRGNVEKKWLPVSGGADLLSNKRYAAVALSFYGAEEIPYTRYEYDDDGLNRLKNEYGPGSLWKNKKKELTRSTNALSGKCSCKQFQTGFTMTTRGLTLPGGTELIDAPIVSVKGMYPVGSLRVESIKDEDGREIITFKDRLGRLILQRIVPADASAPYSDTYHVYNNVGDMIYAISPEGSAQLPESGVIPASLLEQYAQHYGYDGMHRCITAGAPGCGDTHYVYDKLNRVILESTATQRAAGQWTLTKYDTRFRPAVKGIVTLPGATRQSLQNEYGESLIVEDPAYTADSYESQLGYPGTSGPAGFQPYMAWMYDNYKFICANDAEKNLFDCSGDAYTQQGLCTGTLMKQSLTGEVYVKAFKYDHRGNPTRTCLWDLNHRALRLTDELEYDFVGNLVNHTEKYEELLEGEVTEQHTAVTQNTFDINGRLLTSTVSIDGASPVTVQNLKYDEIGRLEEDTAGAGVSYGYDIRSHLTDITTPIFTQNTWYGSSPAEDTTPSYIFANASALTWGKTKGYGHTERYEYDDYGHFKAMTTDNDKVSEAMEANRNADVVNILRKYRGDVVQDAAIVLDGSKISTVNVASTPRLSEGVANITNGYYELGYDADGRLIKDATRDITSITYHPFGNLPQRIQTSDGSYAQSTYFPDGTLYSRLFSTRTIETVAKVDSKGDTTYTERVRTTRANYRYHGNFERTPQGWVYHTAAGHYDLRGKAHYWYVRDRLGSTVAVVDGAGNLCQTTGYYPSGTPYTLPAETLATEVDAATDQLHIGNRWIGHKGLALYDNTARMHDPLLARYHTPDPLCADYPGLSPWSHCAANALTLTDPSGCVIIGVTNRDACSFIEDLRTIFSAIGFKDFASSFTISNGESMENALAPITDEALAKAFANVELNESQRWLVDMVVNTINSKKKHYIEYTTLGGMLSWEATEVFKPKFNDEELLSYVNKFNSSGFPAWTIVKEGGAGATVFKHNGSHSVIIEDGSHSYNRAVTSGHEIFGHGRSRAAGIKKKDQHEQAIRTENLILQVMGVDYRNDGSNHGSAKDKHKRILPYVLPAFK